MGKIIFIVGGARSGKSSFALKKAKKYGGKIAFIATCLARDKEMKKRVALHKEARPRNWHTFENPKDMTKTLLKAGSYFDTIVIDCLTLLVSEYMLRRFSQKDIEGEFCSMVKTLKKIKSRCIIVSNEVGLGIVPNNKLARDFRDIAGRMNQLMAGNSDEVFFTVSGIPWKIK